MPSFDVVSKVDMQEADNAVNQSKKELLTRYDFRGSKSTIELDKEGIITVIADDEMKLAAISEILSQKMSKRGISPKSLDFKDPEGASGGTQRQKIHVKQGLSQDEGKLIVKIIKDKKLKKIQAQIQQDQVRVTGPKRDDLQEVIAILKSDCELPLQYVNFKD